jgi:hypothetical protein
VVFSTIGEVELNQYTWRQIIAGELVPATSVS